MSLNIAEQLEENEQFDKAYEEYKKMHAQKPNDLEILERLGHLAIMLDKKSEAQEFLSKILSLDATNVMAYEQLMDIYAHTDRYRYYTTRGNLRIIQEQPSYAISDFKKALEKTQDEEQMATTRFVLANLYEQTGKHHQAIDEFLRILDTGHANELLYLRLAQIYLNEDAISSAIDTLKKAKDNNFDTDAVNETLAQLYLRADEPELARELTKDELVKVKSLLEEEQNQAAFDILEKNKFKHKNNAQYQSLLAQYYFNVKDFDKSLECVNAFDKLEQNSPLTYQMRALIFEEKGNEFDAHVNWAKYNLCRKDKDVALNEYLLAYQVNPDNADLVRSLAELIEDSGDRNHAAEFWERLVNIEPTNKKALEKFAEFKESIGDYRSEAEVLEKLHSIDRKNAIVVKKMANAYEKIKNKPKALEYYNKFISLSPVNDEYEKVKLKISKLENTQMEEDDGLIGKIMRLFSKG